MGVFFLEVEGLIPTWLHFIVLPLIVFIYITHLLFSHPIVWCSIYSGTTIITLYSVKGKPTSTENELRSGVKVI